MRTHNGDGLIMRHCQMSSYEEVTRALPRLRELVEELKTAGSGVIQHSLQMQQSSALFLIHLAHQLLSGSMMAINPEKLVVHESCIASTPIGTPGSQLSQPSSSNCTADLHAAFVAEPCATCSSRRCSVSRVARACSTAYLNDGLHEAAGSTSPKISTSKHSRQYLSDRRRACPCCDLSHLGAVD